LQITAYISLAAGITLSIISVLVSAVILFCSYFYIKLPEKRIEAEFYASIFPEYRIFIERWNIERFNKLGVNASSVINLMYIQFIPYRCVVLLEPHDKPGDNILNEKKTEIGKKKELVNIVKDRKLLDPYSNMMFNTNQPIVVIHQLVLSN
jgi:hypothetical protein